jgi:predicted DNA-binding transcriptional regulator AlpA
MNVPLTVNANGKRLLSRDDIQDEYGLSRRWLELAAMRGDGPPMRRISARMIRYQRAELEAWLASRRVANTSQRGVT